jgi:Holliday junction resolvasome RuvABC DNA-binding subunit
LNNHGFESVEKIAGATPEALMEVPMVGQKTAQKLILAAKELIKDAVEANQGEKTPEETTKEGDQG